MNIGIVNDSVMATEVLRRIVVSQPGYEVIWTAKDGSEAVMFCSCKKPDLVLMDLMMPVMDGVEATERIMKTTPCPILVVTSTVSGHASEVFKAMGAGALDVVATPVVGYESQNDTGQELLRKISLIGKLVGYESPQIIDTLKQNDLNTPESNKKNYLVAVGCSTGGPNAILEILSSFPCDINASIVIIQHMDEKFVSSMVAWLNSQVKLPVHKINPGDKLKKGTVMLAGSHKHLVMSKNGVLNYSSAPKDNFYKPSVDVFYNSLVQNFKGEVIGALLTGMGRDGAQGLWAIKQQGWQTIAQDEESSIVYGMPKAAAQLDAAIDILPLQKIGPNILNLLIH